MYVCILDVQMMSSEKRGKKVEAAGRTKRKSLRIDPGLAKAAAEKAKREDNRSFNNCIETLLMMYVKGDIKITPSS